MEETVALTGTEGLDVLVPLVRWQESKRFVSGVCGIIHNDGGFVNTEFVGYDLEGGERNW